MKNKSTITLFTCFVVFSSFMVREYRFTYPSYFPEVAYDFSRNKLDSSVIEVGRNLFYDPILSADNSISCASCHSPYNAFAHTDHDLSHGIGDQIGTRNAPALFNLAWQQTFMWDGASQHLETQALAPISHPKEMGSSIADVVKKLNASVYYRSLFFYAFRDSLITGEKVLKSLAQFQLTLVSANSKYDQMKQGKAIFTAQEANGYKLFLKNCNACHVEPLFSHYKFMNNGLKIDTTLNDYGRGSITHKKEDSLLFKTPSLRNLAFSSPYMHDGRFRKLSQVLHHYAEEIEPYQNISEELKRPMVLTSDEKVDIIAFLNTLNDKEFVFKKEYGFPKKN